VRHGSHCDTGTRARGHEISFRVALAAFCLVGLSGLTVASASASTTGSGGLSCNFGVGLTAVPDAGSTPLLVQFNATVTSGSPAYYNWSFGDGSFWNSSVTGASAPFHRYAAVGLYVASVRAAEAGCIASASATVAAVEGPMTVLLAARPASGGAPLSVTFNASVTGGTGTYPTATWSFGDGQVGSGLNVEYTYSASGRFTAVLNVTDSGGHWAVATTEINVTSGAGPALSWAARASPYVLPSVGVGAAAVAGVALYARSRPRGPISGTSNDPDPIELETPPPDEPGLPIAMTSPTSSTSVVPIGGLDSGDLTASSTHAVAGPAPDSTRASPGSDGLRLTQRVILHIGRQGRIGPDEVAPPGLTQAGMAQALGVGQNSLTNVLRRLAAAGILDQDVRHVKGRPRRLRVYRFSTRGELLYRELRPGSLDPHAPNPSEESRSERR